MQHTNIVALIANRSYFPGAFVAAASILEQGLRGDASIVILHPREALTPDERTWIERSHPRVDLLEIGARSYLPEDLSSWDTALAPLFLRFALAEIFPDSNRILYVDSDILALRSVDDVFDYSLLGKLVAAAHDDLVASLVGFKSSWIDYREKLGVSLATPYLNCGVLLIDAGSWRARDVKKILIDTYRSNRERCRFFDQSALNLVLKGDFARLSPAWNFQQNYQAIGAEEIVLPRLVHFAGSAKPWRNDGFVFRSEYRSRYRKLLGPTPFRNYFQPYFRLTRKQAREGWRSVSRLLRGREVQSGIRRSQIPLLRKRLGELLSAQEFIDRR